MTTRSSVPLFEEFNRFAKDQFPVGEAHHLILGERECARGYHMAKAPSSITTMKRFYNDRLHVETREDLEAELLGGNDRSAIITIASHAEGNLQYLIGSSLPHLRKAEQKEWAETFRHDGPLGTFSACIKVALYLTLIDEPLRDQLDDLRDMRNAVAHTHRRVTFDDVELQNVAKRIFAPKGMFPLLADSPDGVRRTFVAEGLLINSMLIFGRDEAVRKTRQSFVESGQPPPF